MKKFIAITAAVAAMSFGLVTSVDAKGPGGGHDRPFKARGNGTNIIETIPDDCDFVIDDRGPALVCDQNLELDFIGTHIGRSTNTSVGFLTVYVEEPCTTVGGEMGFEFESFQAVTIVAANGDELTVDTNAAGCGDGVTEAAVAGTYDITGGTGRFAAATGAGTIESFALGTDLSTKWTGTISY